MPAAARAARYGLLAKAAQADGATHIFTAHTRDDQAETLLMRMLRGSGIVGLAAMARQSERDGVVLARPFLDVSKSQLVATLRKARIGFADDPTNRDTSFTRPRLRGIMPVLAAEGGDPRNLARLASRLARANAAVEILADGAERYLELRDLQAARDTGTTAARTFDAKTFDARTFDAKAFAGMPEEIRLRLLLCVRSIGSAMRGRPNSARSRRCWRRMDRAFAAGQPRLKQTLAGAMVGLSGGRIRIEPAPPRSRLTGRGTI